MDSHAPCGPRRRHSRRAAERSIHGGALTRLLAILVAFVVLLASPTARAAGEDAAVREAVRQIMSEDYPGSLGPARKKLQEQLSVCLKKGCSNPVKAEVYIALGMVASQLGQADDAKQSFKSALQLDPNAKLPSSGVTPTIRAQWDEVKGGDKVADKDKDDEEEQPTGLAATISLIREALKADQEGRLDVCIEKDKQALKIDDSPRTRLHLASCEARAGKLVDALKDAQKALESGIQKKDANVMRIARIRVKELLDRIPHVTFEPPRGVSDLRVTFDDRPVPTDALTKRFSVDPGKHKVYATGTVNGFTSEFEEEYDIKEKDFVTIKITLKPPANDFITPGQIKCMLAAKSQEEVQKCLPQNRKNLVIRLAGDISGYSDTNAVAVYTPAVNASIVSPTAGWNIGGNFLVDAVSAASPDIVASASPPFEEFRYAYGVTGGYKPGLVGAQASLSSSSSPDYVSYTAGARLTAELNDKLITPTIGYTYSYDRVGRGTNPPNWLNDFLPLKGYIHTHEIEGGITFILSPTSLILVGGTVSIERGDGSQPYRYIPMFDPEIIAPFVPRGATVDLVNRTRLPIKPLEQLPTERDRFAVGARFNKRLQNATLRLEQRFYIDTWGMKASSTDGRYMVDLSRHLRVWPHVRLHAQTDTNFYVLAYTAILDPSGQIVVPLYRTGDRELSPLLTGTAGGGVRVGLGEPEGEVRYGITIVGDVMYTRFLNSLYVTSRTAVYGSLGFDVEF
jgi:tetratricopeptide (TPR) repeat protein